jgi:hypothetical protein
VGHFDGVSVPELMWSEPSPDARCDGRASQLGSGAGTRPLATTRPAVEDTEQRADGKLDSSLEPWLEPAPATRVHADLAATSALAATHEQRAAPVIEIAFGERQRFLDTQPGAPKDHDQAAQASPMCVVPGRAHDGDDLLDGRWIGGISETLVPRGSAGVEAGHRRGRSAATSAVEQQQQFGHLLGLGERDRASAARKRSVSQAAASTDRSDERLLPPLVWAEARAIGGAWSQ